MSEAKKTMEAALFMSPRPLSLSELYDITKAELKDLRAALNELIEKYSEEDSAIEIAEANLGYQMRVKPGLDERVSHLASTTQFSRGVMKTLAFIAYKQPIKQSVLIKYRTTSAYDHIKHLEEMGYISREPDDKTYVLRTTKKFVREFGDNPVKLKERKQGQ